MYIFARALDFIMYNTYSDGWLFIVVVTYYTDVCIISR